MKRTVGPIGLAILCAWLVVPGPAMAWQEEPEEADVERVEEEEGVDVEAEEDEVEGESPLRGVKGKGPRGKEDLQHLIKQLTKLQDAMNKKMDLGREQEEVIDKLFEEHLQTLKEQHRARKVAEGEETDDSDMRELREQMAAAREAGDREAMKELREKFRSAMKKRGFGTGSGMSRFLHQVTAELDEEQQETFHELLKRVKLERFYGPGVSPLRSLWRAVMHPEVGLSPEQREKLREIMRGRLTSFGEGGGVREQLGEATEDLRKEVFAELTEEQKAKVEALIEEDTQRVKAGKRQGKFHRRPPGESPDAEAEAVGEEEDE